MNIKELCEKADLKVVTGNEFLDREVSDVYACDLLSWVIGRAKENSALVTVMTNVNVIAVAVMADLSCVILSEGVVLDQPALDKATMNDVVVLSSEENTYRVCAKLANILD